MNWRRGFFRLWAASSAAWVVLVVAVTIIAMSEAPPAGTPVTDPVILEKLNEGWELEHQPLLDPRVTYVMLLALAPPAVLYAMGVIIAWVGSGFQNPR